MLLLLALSAGLYAQRSVDEDYQNQKDRIEQFIPDLKSSQKTRLDIITRRYESRIKDLKSELKEVRDSIRSYMGEGTDRRDVLFPLFERESLLMLSLNKTYYMMKLDIDAVLTPEQTAVMRSRMEAQRKQRSRTNNPQGGVE